LNIGFPILPELPEVETMCRGVRPIVGTQITAAQRTLCKKRPIQMNPRIDVINRRLIGKKIESVSRLGKRAIVWTCNDDALIFEPRMTGILMLSSPPSQEHLRFRLALNGSQRELLFWDRRGLGKVQLVTRHQYETEIASRLGPDALTIDESILAERFRHSQREIKVALLDQSAIAGIGNLYAAEILFAAAVDPRTKCNRIRKIQWQRIAAATRDILSCAIKYEGSTLSDGTYRNAINGEGSYQNHHRVYDRENLPCPVCHWPIVRIVQAQRSTFFCRHCQKKCG
jgi:formamidopyrimidine-DNA glycosylase